ncbi:Gfo/Idh/MocA family protein [[Mannheimia] succiniciproducens]|uniref:MviM protein n=1 Tax=Mannheimia succiniciproducens (strain KCTC 0769BP / MBEL55E) TaxID=221988 RepID=Q65SC5_MANSM|nr:Gfo/Idh/MocA family oxidoreductase [[Mannheimia] succiniciproducens]AAU38135.1 MviM protein [[Mannheimia] succiniciproducens MBEL55E]
MKKINVGIIGTGFIGAAHIEAIRRLGFVDVIALAENNQQLAEQKAKELNIPLAYDCVDKLLANPDIQVVHNCTPNHLHFAINKKVILAGKHVFSEKPLCLTSQEADELTSLAEQQGVTTAVGFVYRNFAMVQQAADMVRDQQIGRVFAVNGHYLQDWMLLETDYNWRVDPKVGGKSRTVADIGSHWCDTVQFVTGKKIKEVFADMSIVYSTRKASKQVESFVTVNADSSYELKPVETEDYASVLVRFEDGSKGSFTVSQVSAGHKNDLTFDISGSEKSLHWEQETPQYLKIGYRQQANQILCDDPSLVNPAVRAYNHFPGGHIEGWPDAFKNMMLAFYAFIAEGKDPQQDTAKFAMFKDGAQIVHIVDTIIESAQQGKWISVK